MQQFVIFDFDGVIIDSGPAVQHAVSELMVFLGDGPVSRAQSDIWMGPSITTSVERVRQDRSIGAERQEELEQFYFQAYVQAAPEMTQAFPGMIELLAELADRDVPRALATMKARSEMQAIGTPLPGIEYFDCIAAPEDYQGGRSKQELVGDAIECLGSAGRYGVMIGDRASDIKAGRHHGLRTIAALWGAGTEEELRAATPDFVADSSARLRALLLDELAVAI